MAKLVLTIDDDLYVHRIIEEALAGFCKLIHAKDGEQGLKLAKKHTPDIILLDIEMPGKSGYQVCQALKEDESTHDIPVMFLSSKVELNDRVKGYSVGASDYIIKPFNTEELMARIKVLYEYRQQCEKLKFDVAKAQDTAAMALAESGDMGRIVRFVGQSYYSHNFQSLSEHLLAFFSPFNLDVVIVFWYQGGSYFYSLESGVCPLEQELLEQHRNASRFVDIGNSTIINYPKISLLIKNMPADNRALYGRYKDLFPHILEVTNEKVVAMERNENSFEQAAQISTALQDIVKQLTSQNVVQNDYTRQFIEQLHELNCAIKQTQAHANPADLTLYMSQLDETMQLLVTANSDLAFIKYQLKQVTESRNELLCNLRSKVEEASSHSLAHQSDIELF